jgi:hypothetical protein
MLASSMCYQLAMTSRPDGLIVLGLFFDPCLFISKSNKRALTQEGILRQHRGPCPCAPPVAPPLLRTKPKRTCYAPVD